MNAPSPHKPVTLADVARAAGVAKSTASHVFAGSSKVSEATSERVRQAAKDLGYKGPSAMGRAFARGRSQVVAVMTAALLEDADTDPFALAMVDGLQREFAQQGYAVVLLPPITDDASRTLADSVVFDGVVTVRRVAGIEATDEYLAARGVPTLMLDGYNNEHDAVVTNDADAMVEVLDHLRELGHERIAAVTLLHNPEREDNEVVGFEEIYEISHLNMQRRLDGFTRAGVIPQPMYKCGVVSVEDGEIAGMELLQREPRPTAIVCMADLHAAGVIEAAHKMGLDVPGDVSVTGFDGLPMARLGELHLTTVVQSGVEKGRASARYLVALMAGESVEPQNLPLQVRLGNTTGPVPQ